MHNENESGAAPAAPAQQPIPDVIFDGFSVYAEMDVKGHSRTSADNVSDVLDAVARLMRKAAPAVTVSPAPREKQLEAVAHAAAMDLVRIHEALGLPADEPADADRIIAHLARQAQPTDRDAEWISVDDDLPEVETDVLVRGTRGNSVCHEVAGLFNGEWLGQNSELELRFAVTHWMPLPAIRALKGKSGSSAQPVQREAVRIIDIGDRRQLRRDGESGWELVDEENKRVRYLNCFEANFVNSAIKAAGKSGSEGAAE